MDRIDLAQDRDQLRALVETVMNLQIPWDAGKFLSSCITGGLSRRGHLHVVSQLIALNASPRMTSIAVDPVSGIFHISCIWDHLSKRCDFHLNNSDYEQMKIFKNIQSFSI
jgi:hypothetical protein